MIGSPALRGAVASLGRAGWVCFTVALAGSAAGGAISAAGAASGPIVAATHGRTAAVECAVLNRLVMPRMFSIYQPAVNKDLSDSIPWDHAPGEARREPAAPSTGGETKH